MSKRKLYFSCALSGLPQEHRQRMIALRNSLSDRFEILEFCDPKQISPSDLYHHDIHVCVAQADLMLAVVSRKAIGLGYEMGTMIEKYGKPVLAVAHQNSRVSPFVIGIHHPRFEFRRYRRLDEIKSLLVLFEQRTFA